MMRKHLLNQYDEHVRHNKIEEISKIKENAKKNKKMFNSKNKLKMKRNENKIS